MVAIVNKAYLFALNGVKFYEVHTLNRVANIVVNIMIYWPYDENL